ncbi:MAG: NADP-dependent phosphogluconate dehydrogenase [Pseudomonadota bacterium]
MADSKPNTGLIGLGTMGANLALNIADNGYDLAVYNRTTETMREFISDAGDLADRLTGAETLEDFVDAMAEPRNIILMVPAGPVVDKQIEALRPLLGEDDLIIDAGNANYEDTNRRAEEAQEGPGHFLGIGVSGGSDGARHGPSIMGGGDKAAWDRVEQMLQAISAKHKGTPCATYMGKGGAGHFVKMVHNGIEYADMQMIAEIYGFMRDVLQKNSKTIGEVFEKWNEGPLSSYLIEISGAVAKADDPKTGKPMLDVILDSAGQKGTGRWTAIEALKIGAPVTVIDAAVAARNMSARIDERKRGEDLFTSAPQRMEGTDLDVDCMEKALLAGKIACYAQGFAMLQVASKEYEWDLPMAEIAKVWRAGCIIRSAMLDDMASALDGNEDTNLLFTDPFTGMMRDTHKQLRDVVSHGALCGNPVPALSAALSYFDTMRTSRGTANMVQGQRDYFGAHGFKRLDEDGDGFHGPWND